MTAQTIPPYRLAHNPEFVIPSGLDPERLITQYAAGEVIPVPNLDDLPAIESVLADNFVPIEPRRGQRALDSAWRAWEHREPLKDALRGRKFHGRLVDVSIEPLERPYDDLVALSDLYGTLNWQKRTRDTIGFLVHAAIVTTATQEAGRLERPVWILPQSKTQIDTHGPFKRIVGDDLSGDAERLHNLSVARGHRHSVHTPPEIPARWGRTKATRPAINPN